MKTLYYSLIHSHLSYGNLVWGNATQSALRQTILLQKPALRLINNAKYNSHTDPRFHSSCILKLADWVEYQAAPLAFDLNTKKLQILFNDIFTFNRDLPNARVTRQSGHLYVAKSYNIFASRLPLISIPKIWNKWMNVLIYQTTQGHFKYQLKTHILTHTQKGWNATTYDATTVTVEPRLLSTQLPPILLVFCDRQNDIGLYDKVVLLSQFVYSCPDASLFSSSLLCSYLYCIFKLWLTLVSSPSSQCCDTLEHRNHPSSIIGPVVRYH